MTWGDFKRFCCNVMLMTHLNLKKSKDQHLEVFFLKKHLEVFIKYKTETKNQMNKRITANFELINIGDN